MHHPMTLTQKILAHHAIGLERPWVQAGDMIRIRVDWTIASELAWNGMNQTYEALGRPPLPRPDRFYLAIDHTVDPVTLAKDRRTQRLVSLSRAFAAEAGLEHFFDANQTIMHTTFYRDLVLPGDVVLGADSHTSSHGGMGAFAIGLGGADVTAAMVLGTSWIEVPEAIAVDYVGRPDFGIGGKDIILETLGVLGRNTVALERTVEYRGEATRDFSADTRFTIANMTAEFGGLNGIFEADEAVLAWIQGRTRPPRGGLYFRADEAAPYVDRYRIDLEGLAPKVALPFSPDKVVNVDEVAGLTLDGCFIGACTTTEEELVLAALVLEAALEGRDAPLRPGRRVVVPGNLDIQRRLEESGLAAIYRRAGFDLSPPGCSMCLGIASERAGRGEVWLSSQNRNYPNRMGEGSLAHLASAATVAASAPDMVVTDPRPLLARVDRDRYARILDRPSIGERAVVIDEPRVELGAARAAAGEGGGHQGRGALQARCLRFGDHVDTDQIIPGQFCHLTDLEEIGRVCFHFVRPEMPRLVREENMRIIVAGEGWGSGSSREHAVWALKGAGVEAIVARSFAFIHKRNLVNEALPFVELSDPAFYELVEEGDEVRVEPDTGRVEHLPTGRVFEGRPAPKPARVLRREGGLVPALRRHGAALLDLL